MLSESAAALAGLKEGDIIQSIDGVEMTSSSEFSERIAGHKPGDLIKLIYLRSGEALTASVTFKGEAVTNTTAGQANRLKMFIISSGQILRLLQESKSNS